VAHRRELRGRPGTRSGSVRAAGKARGHRVLCRPNPASNSGRTPQATREDRPASMPSKLVIKPFRAWLARGEARPACTWFKVPSGRRTRRSPPADARSRRAAEGKCCSIANRICAKLLVTLGCWDEVDNKGLRRPALPRDEVAGATMARRCRQSCESGLLPANVTAGAGRAATRLRWRRRDRPALPAPAARQAMR